MRNHRINKNLQDRIMRYYDSCGNLTRELRVKEKNLKHDMYGDDYKKSKPKIIYDHNYSTDCE